MPFSIGRGEQLAFDPRCDLFPFRFGPLRLRRQHSLLPGLFCDAKGKARLQRCGGRSTSVGQKTSLSTTGRRLSIRVGNWGRRRYGPGPLPDPSGARACKALARPPRPSDKGLSSSSLGVDVHEHAPNTSNGSFWIGPSWRCVEPPKPGIVQVLGAEDTLAAQRLPGSPSQGPAQLTKS